MAATPRKRKQFKFWLNVINPQERYLVDVIQWLTEQGEFVRSIRDGIRLIYDLRFQKDHQSLLEMFPDIRERLQIQATPATGGAGGQSELAREIAAQIVLMGGTGGYVMQSALPTTTPLKVTDTAAAPVRVVEKVEPVIDDQALYEGFLGMVSMFD